MGSLLAQGIMIIGGLAGGLALYRDWRGDKVRLSIRIRRGFVHGDRFSSCCVNGDRLAIWVLNKSNFPVTISSIRCIQRGRRMYEQLFPQRGFATLPLRLEPRTSTLFVAPASFSKLNNLYRFKRLRICTECGAKFDTTNRTFRQFIKQFAVTRRQRKRQLKKASPQ